MLKAQLQNLRNKYNFAEDSHPLIFGGESWTQQKGTSGTVRIALPLCLSSEKPPVFPFISCFLIAFTWMKISTRASLVAQWLRIHLPTQGTQVRALVREDPTCRGATKPMRRNDWACALEPASYNYWAHAPQLLKPACVEPMLLNKRSHQSEKPAHRNKE